MKIQLFISLFVLLLISSCSTEKKQTSKEALQEIVSEFNSSNYYDFIPYYSANLSTIMNDSRDGMNDSRAAITIRCNDNRIKEEPFFGKFSDDQIQLAKKTFNFCKKHPIHSIIHSPQFSEIETSIWDSSYTEIRLSNPNYTDPDIGFYHVENLEKAPYKFSIIILKKGIKVEKINVLKDKKLIPLQKAIS